MIILGCLNFPFLRFLTVGAETLQIRFQRESDFHLTLEGISAGTCKSICLQFVRGAHGI